MEKIKYGVVYNYDHLYEVCAYTPKEAVLSFGRNYIHVIEDDVFHMMMDSDKITLKATIDFINTLTVDTNDCIKGVFSVLEIIYGYQKDD